MRGHSQGLVFASSLFIVSLTITLTLLWPAGRVIPDQPQAASFPVFGGNYQSPQRCRECHEPEFRAWSGTTHANASFDPIFRTYLQQVEQPGECLGCHTTGYDTTSGQFVLAGVTCEACHGPYRSEHPQESMVVAQSEALCGSCHPGTLHEWELSRHGQVRVNCIDCHEVHSQKPRAAATTNELCHSCHQHQIENDIHTAHHQATVPCIACHLARPETITSGAVNGGSATGHSFAVFVSTCADCHDDPALLNEYK